MTVSRYIFRPDFIVKNEVPTGDVNGSNLVFATANKFLPNTLEVFQDGKRLELTKDFTVNATFDGFTLIIDPSNRKRSNSAPCDEDLSVNYVIDCS